jgi:hypothetical protein
VNTAGGAANNARAAADRGLGGMATGGSRLRFSAAGGVANVLRPIGDTERLPAPVKDGSGKLDASDSLLVPDSGDDTWLNGGGGGRVGGSKWRGRVPPVAAAAVLCHVEKEGSAERGRGVEAGNPVRG